MIGPRRPWSGWLDGGHLTLDAVVALVDGELADGPTHRALAHVDHCLTCAAEVTAQRQARRRLRGARMPGAPTSLLSSLRAIPDSAALPPAPGTLALDAQGRFVVRAVDEARPGGDGPDEAPTDEARTEEPSTGGDPTGDDPTGDDPTGGHPNPGDPNAGDPTGRATPPAGTGDLSDTTGARAARRGRRRLTIGLPAAVASGLAVGAVTLGVPASSPTPPAATPRPVVAPARAVDPAVLGARLSLRGDQARGVPGPGAP